MVPGLHSTRDLCYAPLGWARVNVVSGISSVIRRLTPPRASAARARLARAARRLPFWLLLLGVCWFYKFIVAAGTDTPPVYGVYHDLLADGFLSGTLSIPLEPAPALLKAKDPYDYANVDLWSLDASYYKGKYYIYWGPVPALCMAAFKGIFRIGRALGDHYLTLAFHCLALVCGALVIERMLLRLFASKSRWLLALGVAAFAFANPTPHSTATASTYHTAIIAAQAWLFAGFLVAFDAVWHARTGAARAWRLPVAGTLWALALGSRVTTMPAIALLVLLTALALAWLEPRRLRAVIVNLFALGLPLVFMGGALLLYNKLRFDDWFEFGSNIQLSGFPRFRLSSIYVLPNLYIYTFGGWWSDCSFPYLYEIWNAGPGALPRWLELPPDYQVIEPVVGWARAVPLAWLFPLGLVFAPWRTALGGRRDRAFVFCAVSFGVLASITGVIGLGLYGATMRYLGDVTFGLVLLALLGVYALRFHRFGLAAPRLVSNVLGLLTLATVCIGLLLGYQGYNAHFHRYNPALDKQLVNALSFCGDRVPTGPSWMR
jgi:hypothetical protein